MYKVQVWNDRQPQVQAVAQVFKTKGQVSAYINALLEGCMTVNIRVEHMEVEDDF